MGAAEEGAAARTVSAPEPPSDLSAAVEGEFLPGLTLARDFFSEIVQPLLAEKTPGVPYAAALIGPGSDVLGFDTPVSCDHDWGPRLQLFLPERELPERADAARPRAGERAAERVPRLSHLLRAGRRERAQAPAGHTRGPRSTIWSRSPRSGASAAGCSASTRSRE